MKKLKEVRKEIEEIGGPKHHQKVLIKRALDRFKGMSKQLAVRVSQAVKPGKMINSKLYVELGDLWDKGKKKDFEKHLAKNESVEEGIQEATVSYKIDHINSVGDIEKELKSIGAKIVGRMKSTRDDGVIVKFNVRDKNKLKKLVLKHDKDASLDEGLFSPAKKASYKFKGKVKPFSPLQKRRLMKHYKDVISDKPGALEKLKKELGEDTSDSINEDSFKLVDMSRKTAKIADKLAQKAGLDTDFEGGVLGVQLTVHGTKKKIEKWLKSLPLEEGMYTKDDGGAYDGLRIAKYLAHQDGKKWKGLPYGTLSSYISTGMDMLKRNKAKARDILSKPTPRD